jgi:hypothetical protein
MRFFEYVRIKAKTDPKWDMIFSVPNQGGVGRSAMIHGHKMKLEGLKRGVSDIIIAYPTSRFKGAFIELKLPTGKASTEQLLWLDRTAALGYFSALHKTDNVETLIKLVEDYFQNVESLVSFGASVKTSN